MKMLSTVVMTILLAALGAGCGATTKLAVEPMPDSLRYTETVSFEENLRVPLNVAAPNPRDPQEVIRFALSLSERGRHANAAQFLAEASQDFSSINRELEVSLCAAAANEYLKAGDMVKFRETVRQLRQTASKYQYAGFDKHTAALVSLGDIASGGTQPTELTPSALKDLYRIKTSVTAP